MNPATRVGNEIMFEGGGARLLTRRERLGLFLGLPVRVAPPGPRISRKAEPWHRDYRLGRLLWEVAREARQ